MHDSSVGGVFEGTDDVSLCSCGCIAQDLQRGICVSGKHHSVETASLARAVCDLYVLSAPAHSDYGPSQQNLVHAGQSSAHVVTAAAVNGSPLRPVVEAKQSMVGEEVEEGPGGHSGDVVTGTRPDGGG